MYRAVIASGEEWGAATAPGEVQGAATAPGEGRGAATAPGEGRGAVIASREGWGAVIALGEVQGAATAPGEGRGAATAGDECCVCACGVQPLVTQCFEMVPEGPVTEVAEEEGCVLGSLQVGFGAKEDTLPAACWRLLQ